ncbi:carboxymuconolactone decarboxylase family protein [Mycobacterium sp. EPa45]|uniref:carboxymuconolactone decarboxylase family protein n=1 Tax=Mycobacterium sp. EPa45 TaxID=1545728 RepID=UPI001F2EF75C|nr:carboxymuconolactone decarboxylase family protein [Mycobacterium sp. EPa45]
MSDTLKATRPPKPHYDLVSEGRPKGLNILGTLAHHPALARAFCTLNGHLLRATTLTERQRELVIMRVAVLQQSSYEWAQHVLMARDAGLTDFEIAGVAWGPDSPVWDDVDASLMRAVDGLIAHGSISDDTWTVLSTHLDNQQILDVIFTAGAYTTVAWMVEALGIALDDDLRDAVAALIRTARDDG